MKICLVMVTYNRYEVLLRSIQCVLAQTIPVDYFVLVDNNSSDGTPDRLPAGNAIDLLVLADNLGYGAGLSLGIKYALSKHDDIGYFWLMDDDSLADPNLLAVLIESRKNTGEPGLISLMGFIDSLWKGPIRLSEYSGKEERRVAGSRNLYEADHVLIDGALVDKTVVDSVGTPREDLFMMCEDLEYSKRIKQRGFGIFSLPDETLLRRLHMGGGQKFSKGTLWRGYYHARNHLVILNQYFSFVDLVAYGIRQAKFLFGSLVAEDRFRRIGLRLLGIRDGLRGKMGKTIDPAKIG